MDDLSVCHTCEVGLEGISNGMTTSMMNNNGGEATAATMRIVGSVCRFAVVFYIDAIILISTVRDQIDQVSNKTSTLA